MIHLSNVSKSYGPNQVLDRLNLHLQPGEIVALVGPNGVGKTTLINIICNLEKADRGSIQVAGLPNTNPEIFHHLSVMLTASSLYNCLSGYDHLAYIASQHHLPRQAIDDLIDELGLGHYIKKRVASYSLGMTQKLLFAMAVLPKTPFLILDEPHIGLDPSNIIQQRHYLQKLSQSGTGILLSSHHLSEIEHLTDKVFFLKSGRLLQQELALSPGTSYLVTLSPSEATNNWLISQPQPLLKRENLVTLALTEQGLVDLIRQVPGAAIHNILRASDYLETHYRQLYLQEVPHEPKV